jgi:hypothetical protein
MAGEYTYRSSRIVSGRRLGITWDAAAARSGIPQVDPSKFSITASGGSVGFSLSTPDQLLWLAGTATEAIKAVFLIPAYTSLDADNNDHVVQWVLLDRIIAHDETVTFDADAGFIYDDSSTSAVVADQAVQVRTFCDSNGDFAAPRRVGCGDREKLDPATLSPVLRIKASDAAGAGDGNAVTSFTATSGGTITPTGTITYRADSASSVGVTDINGTVPCIQIAAGGKLTSTVQLGSTTADFSIIAIFASENSNGQMSVLGDACLFTWGGPGSVQRRIRPLAGNFFNVLQGGRYENSASAPWKRLAVSAGSYNHASTRLRHYAQGGMYVNKVTATTTEDHSVAIEVQAPSSGAVYLTELIVIDSEITERQMLTVGSWLDDAYTTMNRQFHVDVGSGSDSNSGLTPAAPRLTPPNYVNRDFVPFGSGDCILYKCGGEVENLVIYTRPSYAGSAFSYSSQYPVVNAAYGDRANGRFMITAKSTDGGGLENYQLEPYALFNGIGVRYDRRNPQSTDWAGYTTEATSTPLGCSLRLESAALGAWFDIDTDPALHTVYDCGFEWLLKGIADNTGGYADERWTVLWKNTIANMWYGETAVSSAARTGGLFVSNSSVYCQDGNIFYRCGWNPDIANIGEWSGGSKVFSGECIATYSSSTDKTTITGTGIFADFLMNGSTAGPLLVTLKRTSDATEHKVSISSRTSGDEIVVNGNPFSLADAGSVADCICHGGSPCAEDGRMHGAYISDGSTRSGTLNIANMYLDCADHGFQMRGGGWAIGNVIINCAIGGFVAGKAVSVINGNIVIGGHRTRGDVSANGPRCWGLSLLGSNGHYYGEMQGNIFSLPFADRYSDFDDAVSGTTYAMSLYYTDTGTVIEISNNTIARGAGKLLDLQGTTTPGSNVTVERNMVIQPTTSPDAVTQTVLTDADYEGANWSYNIYYHPDGATANRFDGNTTNFAGWQTLTGSTGDQFKLPTFADADADAASYYATLSGGSDNEDAFNLAAYVASLTDDWSGFTAADVLSYIRSSYKASDINPDDDGDGTFAPGAMYQGSAPAIVNLSPSDNATGAADTQTLAIQFTDNIAYNDGSALIEAWQGGMQVASDRVDSGTINLSDKTQYSLGGLLTGLSGAVSIRISNLAFRSLDTGLPFAGIADDTTWNFTIGTTAVVGGTSTTKKMFLLFDDNSPIKRRL